MRVFWALIALLLLGGAAAAFLLRESPQPSAVQGPDPSCFPAVPAAERSAEPMPPAPPAKGEPTSPQSAVDFTADLNTAIGNAIGASPEPRPTATGTAVELPTSEAWPPAKIIRAKAVRNGDELVIDGKYHVKGGGTEADPYVIPFELLMSAGDVYDPRKGLTKMPQRVAFLHEKHVRITGYVAFPIAAGDPRSMLVMFNQWDGCCIGVPPTTYDSIETNLDKPAAGADKFITYGTTTGVLKVDPYVDNGWLLGLYILDHAKLSDTKSDPVSPKQLPDN